MTALELRSVDKSYAEGDAEHVVLQGAELQIKAGEFVVLLGRSGSGKSTLLNLLSGIDLPDAGEILFGETPLQALSEHERTLLRRRRVGFVFQFFNLLPTLTVEENLLLPLELNGHGREASERATNLLDRVGLADRRTSFPDVLSGGERQRVALARALAHDPDVILADEPTGNLDPDTAESVLDLLVEAVREAGKTLVLATHSLDVAARGDRALRVQGGKLVAAEI